MFLLPEPPPDTQHFHSEVIIKCITYFFVVVVPQVDVILHQPAVSHHYWSVCAPPPMSRPGPGCPERGDYHRWKPVQPLISLLYFPGWQRLPATALKGEEDKNPSCLLWAQGTRVSGRRSRKQTPCWSREGRGTPSYSSSKQL